MTGRLAEAAPPQRLPPPFSRSFGYCRMPDRRSTEVPGQYLGFSLQASRLFDHLLKAQRGDVVALEVFADTGIIRADGTVVAEEGKSRTADGNPIADRSADFWRTLRNWVEASLNGKLDPAVTTFRLYVSREFRGGIAELFASASDRPAAQSAFARANELLGESDEPAPQTSTPPSPPRPNDLSFVLQQDPAVVAAVIENFCMEFGSGRSADDLRQALELYVADEYIDQVMRGMLGWIKLKTDSAIEMKEPAVISYEDFRRELNTLIRKLHQRNILESFAGEPAEGDVREHLEVRKYVRQLDLIQAEDDEKVRAVIDFLKAEADRVEWARRGEVHRSSMDAFQADLLATWRTQKRRCDILHRDRSDIEKGMLLYCDCSLHRASIEGVPAPDHYCRGSLHALADEPLIGWHPNYEGLLEGE
jgi:hypothetical protein